MPKATDFTIVTVIFIVLFWDSVSLMTYYYPQTLKGWSLAHHRHVSLDPTGCGRNLKGFDTHSGIDARYVDLKVLKGANWRTVTSPMENK
jgi:hypothetical protein